MLSSYLEIGGNISIKVFFLECYLNRFQGNCGDVSDEEGERFKAGHRSNRRALPRAMGQKNDDRLLLEYKKGYKCLIFSPI